VFNKLKLNYKQYVSVSSKYSRPEETRHLKGDSTKLRTELGWEPDYTFESMIDEMIEYYQSIHQPKVVDTTSYDATRLSDIHGWI
jgi:GDPmannose 4,6-dehydratase